MTPDLYEPFSWTGGMPQQHSLSLEMYHKWFCCLQKHEFWGVVWSYQVWVWHHVIKVWNSKATRVKKKKKVRNGINTKLKQETKRERERERERLLNPKIVKLPKLEGGWIINETSKEKITKWVEHPSKYEVRFIYSKKSDSLVHWLSSAQQGNLTIKNRYPLWLQTSLP